MYSKGVPFAWGKAETVVDVECTKKCIFEYKAELYSVNITDTTLFLGLPIIKAPGLFQEGFEVPILGSTGPANAQTSTTKHHPSKMCDQRCLHRVRRSNKVVCRTPLSSSLHPESRSP